MRKPYHTDDDPQIFIKYIYHLAYFLNFILSYVDNHLAIRKYFHIFHFYKFYHSIIVSSVAKFSNVLHILLFKQSIHIWIIPILF